jgi:urea carboxylase system permease
VPPANRDDTQDLASFGYRQELDRSLGSFSTFAAGFSYISVLTGVFQMFYLGYAAAGPAFFWTWPIVFLGQFTVALTFAELAAHYPLSGGVYQWSRRIGSQALGWMAGWVYLACAIITLAAVALALQASLPRISPLFQFFGDGTDPADQGRNAVLLGCGLVLLTTLINLGGVRLMARINNVGVFTELFGVVLLIILLLIKARRGPSVLLQPPSTAGDGLIGWLAPFLAAAVMPSYVMYGFDTAGTLAEETRDPRRRAPWAILRALAAAGLTGGLLIIAGILAVSDTARADLGRVSGGLPAIVQESLGSGLGTVFLVIVVFAVMVCALAVHTSAVRLMFAMARDNNLPFAGALARISHERQTPAVPVLVTGIGAALILLINANLPRIIETLCTVSLLWANLAYLMVTLPLLLKRLRGWPGNAAGHLEAQRGFSLGRWGLPLNLLSVAWGLFVIVNMSWPRPEIYGDHPFWRFAAVYSTAGLFLAGTMIYFSLRRESAEVLPEHAVECPPTEDLYEGPSSLTPIPTD